MRSATSRVTSFCRLCDSWCGVLLAFEDGRIARVLGDAHRPISGGYTCPKGRRVGDLVQGPDRLTTSMRRTTSGAHEPVPVAHAVADIADRLRRIVDRHGPDAVALFMGTQQNFAALTPPIARAWFKGTGSHKVFSAMTIDQSAKSVVAERMCTYLGGRQRFEDADVWLLVGTNPVVSSNGGDRDGAVAESVRHAARIPRTRTAADRRRPATHRDRSPRRCAPRAPAGTDAVLLAGLLRVALTENLHDAEFCARYTADLQALRNAVAEVSPAVVQRICGVPANRVTAAARIVAGGNRGIATSGTGLCMGPHSNLAEHLVAALNVVCGRYLREEERADDRAVLTRNVPARAEVAPPSRACEHGFRSRVGGVRALRGELPSGMSSTTDGSSSTTSPQPRGNRSKFAGRILDPAAPPSSEQMLAMMAERGRVPWNDLVAAPHGHLAEPRGAVVGPPTGESVGHRLALMPDEVRAELRAALTGTAVTERLPLLLTVRRIRKAVKSTGTRVPGLVPGGTNPASVHPDDLPALGIADGQAVTVRSASGRLRATARADATLARGTVTMTHCFGSVDPSDAVGVNVHVLTGSGDGVQTINAMPTMTAVPVAVEAAPEEDA